MAAPPILQEFEVKGLLIGTDWDNEGVATSLMISAPQEIEYVVQKNQQFEALKSHSGRFVSAYGLVQNRGAGQMITVESFCILPHLLAE